MHLHRGRLSDARDPAPRRRGAVVGATVLVLVAAGIGALVWSRSSSGGDAAARDLAGRRADVERRGESVMPFDQDKTVHHFRKTATGGVETVTTTDERDATQIRLVRAHLAHERDLFAAGDFTDPMAIHGMHMPGLDVLRRGAAAGQLSVTYDALRDGARLTYSSNAAELVDALHSWFDAQLMDHGSHATG